MREYKSTTLSATTIFALSLVFASGCSDDKKSAGSTAATVAENTNFNDLGTIFDSQGSDIERTSADIPQLSLQKPAVRTGEELYNTMTALAGLDPTTPALLTFFNSVRSTLPSHSGAELSSAFQVSIFRLAAQICIDVLQSPDPDIRAAVFGPTINKEDGTLAADVGLFSVESLQYTAITMLSKFWSIPAEELLAESTEVKTLTDLAVDSIKVLGESINGQPAPTATIVQTRDAVFPALCAATLASFHVTSK